MSKIDIVIPIDTFRIIDHIKQKEPEVNQSFTDIIPVMSETETIEVKAIVAV